MKSTKHRKADVRRRREEERRREAERRKRSEAARRGWITRRKHEEERRREAERRKRSEAARRGWITRRKHEEERKLRAERKPTFDHREFASLYDAARAAGISAHEVTRVIRTAASELGARQSLTDKGYQRIKQLWDKTFQNINPGYWFVLWRPIYGRQNQ